MNNIEHAVPLPDGSVANTVGPVDVIARMYPAGLTDTTELYNGIPVTDRHTGIETTPINSTLRFVELPEGKRAILGNTVTRLCPVAASCGSCALGGQELSVAAMSERNCARANTARAFELADVPPEGRFMMLPVPAKDAGGKSFNDYYVVSDDRITPEYNGAELMQQKLAPACAVVFTKSWLQDKGLAEIATGMQGADGSKGVAIAGFDDALDTETLIMPFCSLRQNMGDRAEKDQILRGALTAYFDQKGYDDAARARLLSRMNISVTFAASASLENFAHQIQLPAEDSDKARDIKGRQADLVTRAGGRITSAIVLNDQYPGAIYRGNIVPEFEAHLGERVPSPITPDNCPGDGQYCHIDYRAETQYALERQLVDMGVPAERIRYEAEGVLDPADPANKAASNRAEQNNGVQTAKTNRTLNAMIITLPE